MIYRIRFTESALKDLKKIPSKDLDLIERKLNEYKENPLNYCRKLSGKNISTYRFRIENYRAIFDLDKEFIVIHRIGHRKDIYKK